MAGKETPRRDLRLNIHCSLAGRAARGSPCTVPLHGVLCCSELLSKEEQVKGNSRVPEQACRNASGDVMASGLRCATLNCRRSMRYEPADEAAMARSASVYHRCCALRPSWGGGFFARSASSSRACNKRFHLRTRKREMLPD